MVVTITFNSCTSESEKLLDEDDDDDDNDEEESLSLVQSYKQIFAIIQLPKYVKFGRNLLSIYSSTVFILNHIVCFS